MDHGAIYNISARLTKEEKKQLEELVTLLNSGVGKVSQAEAIRYCIRTIHKQEFTRLNKKIND